MRKIVIVVVAFGLLLGAGPVLAHHSFSAEFDASKPVTVTGTVTKVEWQNPHIWFYVDVKDEKTGKVEKWGWEMGGPNSLLRNGWTRNSLKIGEVVTVEGSRAKDGSTNANSRSVVIAATGQRLLAGSSQGVNP